MPTQSLETDAFVLQKRLPADSFQGFTVFSATQGLLMVLQRLPKPPAASATRRAPPAGGLALDLFDEVSLRLESSNQGRTWFVKEAQLVHRPADIGRSYETLQHASLLATLIARNTVHEESRAAVAVLLRDAFAAFASGARPEVIYFKGLYRFARHEGYPLKEQWFPTLPAADRAEVAALLNRPLAEQTATPATVSRLQHRLEVYLRGHTEILLD